MIERVVRQSTEEEREDFRRIAQSVEQERPEIEKQAREAALQHRLNKLVSQGRRMLDAAERGEPPERDVVDSFREAIEEAASA